MWRNIVINGILIIYLQGMSFPLSSFFSQLVHFMFCGEVLVIGGRFDWMILEICSNLGDPLTPRYIHIYIYMYIYVYFTLWKIFSLSIFVLNLQLFSRKFHSFPWHFFITLINQKQNSFKTGRLWFVFPQSFPFLFREVIKINFLQVTFFLRHTLNKIPDCS